MTTEARPDLEARARMLAHELLGLVPGRADETDPAFVCVMAYVLEAERREASLKDEVKHWHDVVVGDGEEIAALRAEREVLQRERDAYRQMQMVSDREASARDAAVDGDLEPLVASEWSRMGAGLACPDVSPRETFAVCIRSAFTAGQYAAGPDADGRLSAAEANGKHKALIAVSRRWHRDDDETFIAWLSRALANAVKVADSRISAATKENE